MKIELEIPDEFEHDLIKSEIFDGGNKIEDCLSRTIVDLKDKIRIDGFCLVGNYELEILEMLKDAFGNCEV